ncbi:hypothetical protein ACIQ6U_03705 [Lysinibacillus fusiformis]|uniref:hypothetical protein n=1 Tax=Lysinibacillus fusiformis TaxID=28031 RepID=UPI0037F7CF42
MKTKLLSLLHQIVNRIKNKRKIQNTLLYMKKKDFFNLHNIVGFLRIGAEG